MKVSAVVISHGHADELEQSLPALAAQVDELLVIANIPGSLPPVLPEGARVLENARRLSFAANANLGAASTEHELVLIANPDAIPEPGAVGTLRTFMEERPRAGVTGPRMLYSDGSWQASRRGFPTIGATLVRRTPLRLLFPPLRWQRRHYLLDERPEEPVQADTMLGAFLLLRRGS
jgi:N-acetylglucosaminyl-diphospho-decaprenol L-rhamnosyltransferase